MYYCSFLIWKILAKVRENTNSMLPLQISLCKMLPVFHCSDRCAISSQITCVSMMLNWRSSSKGVLIIILHNYCLIKCELTTRTLHYCFYYAFFPPETVICVALCCSANIIQRNKSNNSSHSSQVLECNII